MNQELWNKILIFDFDSPPTEYGFSTRLSNENFWTIEFTNQAILEYKKFMYLAATSNFMVSPSKIVDIVWHQHLIFTQSYQNFCNILGKLIQHIPSTHNSEESEKFKQAKERTLELYEKNFGKQPKNFWIYQDMFGSLELEKAKFKLSTFIILGILAFILLTVPAYFLLKPIYIQIDNPYFIFYLTTLTFTTFTILEFYNKSKLRSIVSCFDENSFVFNLQPFELVYLKTQNIAHVINGAVNELVNGGIIKINENKTIELLKNSDVTNNSQFQVISVLSEIGTTYYSNILKKLVTKPIFRNISNNMDALTEYIVKSKKFNFLFYKNFTILISLVLFSFTRIVTGILRDRPVTQIVFLTILLTIITVLFLHRLTKLIATTTIPNLYKNDILPTRRIKNNWQWNYFLLGTVVLTPSFAPLVNYIDKKNNGVVSSCGSSCGSSCSSCGGCGGD